MKQQKNKIVFVLVMVCVVLFITVYAILTFGKDKKEELEPNRIPMPDLEESQMDYGTKLEAIEAIKEEREITAPQVYPDHMVDEKGYFNPDYMEYEKQRIIDSVFRSTNLNDQRGPVLVPVEEHAPTKDEQKPDLNPIENVEQLSPQDIALEHQLFFASNPQDAIEITMEVRVDGTQTVRDGQRLALRLVKEEVINGQTIPRNTRIFGFVKIRPNRIQVDISMPLRESVQFVAHDLQDGREGIYIENRLFGEVKTDALDGMIGQVNLPGVPQINGIRRIFQRNNQRVKVTVLDNYQMILKPEK